ncbi:hypothetical protein FEM03_17040 [Phragmitibacter flavus]|uniref:Uncharacterized protein n=1 Tax=Phragmitibacter flavus TaxID=2576071 RepID=A0A5R8KBI0_9BACT|nr:glycosyltransferase family 39 protein [Phragmitibacter flavus]TLD69662.1 hypothetical protein FEM03_17040 [Phragmitibacter flavus]
MFSSFKRAPLPTTLFCILTAIALLLLHLSLPPEARHAIELRLAESRRPRAIDHALTLTWWSSAVGAVLMLIAALTTRWWRGPQQPPQLLPQTPHAPWSRTAWLAILAILLFAGGLRALRLDLGLYNDEVYTFRRHIAGDFRQHPKTGEQEFRHTSWANTAWLSEVGNNSPPFSILARLSHQTAQKITGAPDGEIIEWAMRLPVWITGIAGILMLGVLARDLGSPDRGFLVMLLASIHPWHIRYSSEGRGHGFLLLLLPLLAWLLIKSLRHGTWRNWLSFGIVQMLTMWTFPGAMHPLLLINATLVLWLAFRWFNHPLQRTALITQSTRWILCTLFGAGLFFLAYAPAANQMRTNLSQVSSLNALTPWGWLPNIATLMLTGKPWHDPNPDSTLTRSFERAIDLDQHLPVAALLLLTLLAIAGLWWWIKRGISGWLILVAGFPTIVLAFTVSRLTNTVLHEWYALSSLPFVLLLISGSVGWAMQQRRLQQQFALPLIAVALLPWCVALRPVLSTQTRHSVQPLREVVHFIHGDTFPHYNSSEKPLLAAFWTDIGVYAPCLQPTHTVADLQALATEARTSGRTMWITFAHRSDAMKTHGELIHHLENSGEYEHITNLTGFGSSIFNHHLYRLNDSSSADQDS